jgi:hypothetical protein
VLTYALYLYLSGFTLFLLGFSIFMYFENRKFGDNQFTMKLLPPPPRVAVQALKMHTETFVRRPVFVADETASAVFSEAA